ncbi:peptidase inhibitor family I36 [Streptomyces sp. Amel2xB2]|nr:peptidase inhibitor family I36 [Streptomyces sp. Amel2xB2]
MQIRGRVVSGGGAGRGPASGSRPWRRRRSGARGVATGLALGAALAGGLTAPATAASAASGAPKSGTALGTCAKGALCLWPGQRFRGERRTYEVGAVRMEDCRRLPRGVSAKSFANRTGHPVTVYESAECAETREFHTHPSGSWTPEGAYAVRAFKVWEH